VDALDRAVQREAPGGTAARLLDTLRANTVLAAHDHVPLCQDTGTLTFWFDVPATCDRETLVCAARNAVAEATRHGWLRQNTILEPEGVSQPSNLSESHPTLHIQTWERPYIRVRLLLKGGGSENMSRQYSLPDAAIQANRDLDGVRRCLLDAVWRAQGNGCAPGILGVCIGGDRSTGFEKAKEQLLRPVGTPSPHPALAALETRVLEESRQLGIGPMGMGGETTLLGVHIATASRLPASYFVTVAYMCWACRRGTLLLSADGNVHIPQPGQDPS